MKNIVIVSSTYRSGGNSECLAEACAKGAKEAGNEVKILYLKEIDLKFCIGCLSCLKSGKCVLNDGINDILPVVQNADVLVFATPVYYYAMSGQLKTFLDRLNPLYGRDNRFKEIYLLATAAENAKEAVDGTVRGVQGWIDCFEGVTLKEVVYGVGVERAGEVRNTPALMQAYRAGLTV